MRLPPESFPVVIAAAGALALGVGAVAALDGNLWGIPRGVGGARLLDARPGPVVTSFHWAADGLRLEGVVGGAPVSSLTLSSGAGEAHEVPVQVHGEWWAAHLPAHGQPGSGALRWLQPGRWVFNLSTSDEGQR